MPQPDGDIIAEFSLSVPREADGSRLDAFLGSALEEFSRSYLKKLILLGSVRLNGAIPKPAKTVRAGDVIEISVPRPVELEARPQDIPLRIIHEDEHIVVVDKPAGMVVHPAAGHADGTLVNALLHHCGESLSSINGVLRPGIVHRLDRTTSGVIVAAKTDLAHRSLVSQFKERKVRKRYFALVHGRPAAGALVEAPLGRHRSDFRRMAVRRDVGRPAATLVLSVLPLGPFSAVHLYPRTGRTHQIRVHMRHLGSPLLCDDLYGREIAWPADSPVLERTALHAAAIAFTHPATGEPVAFASPLPPDIMAALELMHSLYEGRER